MNFYANLCNSIYHKSLNKNPPETGGISVSGIALILLAAHKCVFYWPVSHANYYVIPADEGLNQSLPPGGRWHGKTHSI